MINPTRRVLVTGAGGAAAISFMKAVEGEPVDLYAGDIDVHAAGLYRVRGEHRLLLLRGDDPSYPRHLLEICQRYGIRIVVPTVDCELSSLAAARTMFDDAGITLVMASRLTIDTCLDKLSLLDACASVVPVPRYALFDASFDATGWQFPLIVKPRTGSGSRGIVLVESPAQLAALLRSEELLVQEYLPGEEYSVDVYANSRGWVVAAVPRVRLKVDSGIAVAAKTIHDRTLEMYAERVARRVCLQGVANVQFRRNSAGEPALLEVNPRFPGTMPLTVAAGVNMPRLALGEAMGGHLAGRFLAFRDVAVVRHLEETFVDSNAFDRLAHEADAFAEARIAS